MLLNSEVLGLYIICGCGTLYCDIVVIKFVLGTEDLTGLSRMLFSLLLYFSLGSLKIVLYL